MFKNIKILQIIVITFFSFSVISCFDNKNNSTDSSISNKRYKWVDIPKGPYYEHVHGGITTDKKISKDYLPEAIPPKIDLSNTLTNDIIKIDNAQYAPTKKILSIKWKKKNEFHFFSNNNNLISKSKFLQDIFKHEKVKTPNSITFEGDLTNNFKKIKVDGNYVNPTKAEYTSYLAKKVYKFNDKYYSDIYSLIRPNFTTIERKFFKNINEINLDGKTTKLKLTYNFLEITDQEKDSLASQDKSLFFVLGTHPNHKNKNILFNIRNYILKEFDEANFQISTFDGKYHKYDNLKHSSIAGGDEMVISFQENGSPSFSSSYTRIVVFLKGKEIFSESFSNDQEKIEQNKNNLIKLYSVVFKKSLESSDFMFVYRNKLDNWEQEKINYFNLRFSQNVLKKDIKKLNNNIKIYNAVQNTGKSLNNIHLKLNNEEKYYSSIEKINFQEIDNPKFDSPNTKINGTELALSTFDSKIYFENMNLIYKLNYLGATLDVPEFFTKHSKLLQDQEEKLINIHEYEKVSTFPNNLSALKDSSKNFLLDGIRQTSLFTWKNLPASFYLFRNKVREDNIFTTNYKKADGYRAEKVQEIQLPSPDAWNSPGTIEINGKHYLREKIA